MKVKPLIDLADTVTGCVFVYVCVSTVFEGIQNYSQKKQIIRLRDVLVGIKKKKNN